MATREDTLRRMAYLCRNRHDVALWVIAYLTVDITTEFLESALEGAEELAMHDRLFPRSHYEVFVERFGVEPGR